MRVFDRVLKSLKHINVNRRRSVPMTEIDAVTRSIKMRVATWLSVREPMTDYGSFDGISDNLWHGYLRNQSPLNVERCKRLCAY